MIANDYTEPEKATAEELEIPLEDLRNILDTYIKHCANDAQRRREVSQKRLEAYGLSHPPVD